MDPSTAVWPGVARPVTYDTDYRGGGGAGGGVLGDYYRPALLQGAGHHEAGAGAHPWPAPPSSLARGQTAGLETERQHEDTVSELRLGQHLSICETNSIYILEDLFFFSHSFSPYTGSF